jgi:hypothetical protein
MRRASPPFWAANESKPTFSQGIPIRSICALMSSGSAEYLGVSQSMTIRCQHVHSRSAIPNSLHYSRSP